MIFADSSGFIATLDARDQRHKRAAQAWKSFESEGVYILTTQLVVAETVTHLRRRAGWEPSRRIGEVLLRSQVIKVVGLSSGQLDPGKDEIDLANTDFTLQISGLDAEFTPQDPTRTAAGVQQTAPAQRQVGIIPYGSVGYESGPRRNDRYGNQTGGRGVRTSVGVGVILDRNPPASTSQDRRVMQQELEDKGLPQGVTDAPIAGYLYFAVEKLPKNAEHRLEYETENGETIVLLLSRK